VHESVRSAAIGLGGPAGGRELGHARQGVTALQFVDGVLEVASGINAEDDAVVDQGVGHREAFATAHGAFEKEISAPDSIVSDASFGSTVVDFGKRRARTSSRTRRPICCSGSRCSRTTR
jgi:hypothetical protein